ncbi:uncharacterized protein [Epargyreus clarus]|uniref:uncharacterized protein n=1 Tax=Epargyreus clarus TaxID=520877 RepID=UPI003C2F76F7
MEDLNQTSRKTLFQSSNRWIVISNQNQPAKEVVPKELMNMELMVDAETIVVREIEKETYEIHFIYKIGTRAPWITEYYGRWHKSYGFQKLHNFMEITALRRLNLRGHEITICFVLTNNDSINHLTDGVSGHIDTITKVNFPTINQLLDFLNASRKFIFAETWGYMHNGTWNGMTGYLVKGEVEIGGSPMFFTSQRMSIVEYISSPTPTRSKFVFQQPKLSYENNLFLLSFQYTVWYSSMAFIFLLFCGLFAVAKWERKKNNRYRTRELRRDDGGVLKDNITDIAILIFGATCQQGSPVELKGSLGRVVMLVLFLTLMFLYTSYSANIVALLQSSSTKIKTLEDLLKSRIKFGVHDTVFNRYYFEAETEPIRKAIYETKVAPPDTNPNFLTMEEGVKRMRKGLFAFHMETGVGYKFVGKYFEEGQKCGLKEIQYLQVIDPWLAVKKNTSFKEMFKIGYSEYSKIIWEDFGTWTPINGLTKTNRMSMSISMRRKDLAGLPIATSFVITDASSKSELNSLNNIKIDTISKTGYRLIGPLYNFMNATRVIVFSDTWGYLINGSWTGMIGNIVRGEAELTGTVSFLTLERLEVLDYLSYPSPLTARFVFREPVLSYQNNLFLMPFKSTVWFCIIALIAVLGLILYVNATWERRKMMNINTSDETTLRPNISDIAIMIIGAISQQGSSTELKGTLGRVVMFLLFSAFVFFYISYSANIIVLLQSTSNQIRTLTDLYNSKLELGAEDTPYNRHHFSTATERIRKAIYENKIAPRGSKPNFLSLEDGVKKLQTQPFAFNMNLGTGYKAIENYFYEHEKCGLQEIEYFEMNKPWQGCRKNSPYKEIYKIGLVRSQEHGLNDRENRIVYAKKPICSVHGGGFASVSMIDFYPALLMLLYGIVLSWVLLLAEILYHRRTLSPVLYKF